MPNITPEQLTLKPTCLLIRQLKDEELGETFNGGKIIIPDTKKQDQGWSQGVIVLTGSEVSEPLLAPGMRVIIPPMAGSFLTLDDEDYKVIFEDQIIAVV